MPTRRCPTSLLAVMPVINMRGCGGLTDHKSKTRPGAATPERVQGKRKYQHSNNTTWDNKISSILLEGQSNAIPRRELERITGLDGRAVRLLIERERRSGTPILSDCVHGYFLPGDDQERAACVRSLRHRARQIWATARAIEGDKSRIMDGQIAIIELRGDIE